MKQRLTDRTNSVPTTTRWSVSVSRETDAAVRKLLLQRGMKRGDLSRFIEDAVKWRVLDQSMAEARDRFADLSREEIEALIEEATTAARRSHKGVPS